MRIFVGLGALLLAGAAADVRAAAGLPEEPVTGQAPEAPPPAAGGEAGTPAPQGGAQAPDRVEAEREGTPGKKKKARDLELAVKGRVYLDLALDERRAWERDLTLGSARVALEGRVHGILTVLEAELAAKNLVRDAYVRLDGPFATRLHAGRFKAPFSVRELASSWRLPLVERGVVNDYVVERNGLGGRHVGAMASVRPWAGRVELDVAAFGGERGPSPEARSREDLSAAAFVRPWRWLELGATGYQANAEGDRRRAGTAHLGLALGPFGATVEAMAGRLREGPFTAGTALVSWEQAFGRVWRAGPALGAEGLQLRDGTRAVGWATTAGAVLHHARGLKVKLEGERARRPGDAAPANVVRIRLGTRF